MRFNQIIDPLYGEIQFPSFINRLLLCPELLRLKEIRMSNINFFNFTGFSDSSRYEHAIGTAFLAFKATERWDIDQKDKLEIITAALFHDVATPPFGHVTEAVYKEQFKFDHEEETAKIILGQISDFRKTDIGPIYAGEAPKLKAIYQKTRNPRLDVTNVFLYTQGKGTFGRIIKGNIDLDNIDNVIRSAYHIGLQIDKNLPLNLATSFLYNRNGNISLRHQSRHLIKKWLEVRDNLYTHLLLNTQDLNRETMLKYVIKKAVELAMMKQTDWLWTDSELIGRLTDPERMKSGRHKYILELMNRIRLGIYFREIGLYWVSDPIFYSRFKTGHHLLNKIQAELSDLLKTDIVINSVPDKRSRRIDDFRLVVEEPLFKTQLPEEGVPATFGEEHRCLLLCVYSVRPTIAKRDGQGKAILGEGNVQLKYNTRELRIMILDCLKKYVRNPDNISVFGPKLLESGKS